MKSKSVWYCVAVTTTTEAEEAVAAWLERRFHQAPSIWSHPEQRISVVSIYSKRATAVLRAMKPAIRRGIRALAALDLDVGVATVTVRAVQARDWAESWKRHFKPMSFGNRLLVKPTWSRRAEKKGQSVVLLDPGLSFGTGQHATTRFCLEELVSHRDPATEQGFCDMGTGSGILAIAAAKLGYAPVHCFDFDPDCVRIAGENAALNGVGSQVAPIVADLTQLPRKSRQKFDVVCANLIYDLLLAERDRILERLKPGGRLVLAGILSTQFDVVAAAYRKAGLKLLAARTEKEWRSGVFS